MNIPDEAVEAAAKAHLAHKAVRSPGNALNAMRTALEAATPYLLRSAADYLEERFDDREPKDYAEQQYQAGYADAVARLLHRSAGAV